jgi:triphosphatase
LSRKLKPVFVTHVGRRAFSIHRNGSEIELALDQGKIEAGQKSSPLHQISDAERAYAAFARAKSFWC